MLAQRMHNVLVLGARSTILGLLVLVDAACISRKVLIPKNVLLSYPSSKEMRFLFVGDTGTGNSDQYAVAEAMEKRCQELGRIDGLLFLGDQFYMKGVASVDDPLWEKAFETPYGKDCLRQFPVFPTLGNHDYKGNIKAFVDYQKRNPRWHFPHRFYSVDFGDFLRVIAIDTNRADVCLKNKFCMVNFLVDRTNASPRWTIVTGHHPIGSSDTRDSSHGGRTISSDYIRSIVCNRADFYLAGHTHLAEHRTFKDCRVNEFVAGAGGAELNAVTPGLPGVKFAKSQYSFGEVELKQESATFRIFSVDNQVLYETTITK